MWSLYVPTCAILFGYGDQGIPANEHFLRICEYCSFWGDTKMQKNDNCHYQKDYESYFCFDLWNPAINVEM